MTDQGDRDYIEAKAFYARLAAMRVGSAIERAVAAIWTDATNRRGWRQAADRFDTGDKNEILDLWIELVKEAAKPIGVTPVPAPGLSANTPDKGDGPS